MSKDSLIKGTMILALAALVARVLGVVQRIPLVYLIGDTGMATFGIAFNIYTPLLTIATAGIPSALSKLVSEKMELGLVAEANRIYKAAIQFALAAGVVMTAILILFAPYYANEVAKDPDAVLSIRALAPALILFPLIAMMRGYFQGRRMMMPNGLSQIVEQIARLITAVGLAYLLLKLDWGETWAIGGASFGGVMGSVGAVAVLIYYYMRLRRADEREGIAELARKGQAQAEAIRFRSIYGTIFKVSVPIVLFSMTVPLIYFIDSSTVITLLQGQMGAGEAKELLGILTGRAQSLAGIPIILAIALSQSVVPIVSSAYARKDMDAVRQQATKALQLSVITGLPAVLAIAIAARPVNAAMFPVDQFKYLTGENGNGLIAFLTVTALFQIVMQTSGSILMGLGSMRKLVLYVFVGLACKLAGSYLLSMWFGIYGIMSATALCFVVMMVLNLRELRRQVDYVMFTRRRWLGLGITTVVIVAVGLPLEWLTNEYVTWFPGKVNYFVNAAVVSGVCVLLYPVLLMATRVYTKADAADLPAPVRKVLAKLSRRG
ncbi:putative polysaccharide biosynthesis protein [Gorillibacterium sp. sgz5001074]|uniref:putative polysaccharide biosynthesis protein n=1 Tax=Gorillibacterium sp. sgz5001074 TaxID=3446695 RepID=UPI003F6639A3